jgi:uncharacterized membrane protein YeaQ/YmgE (transglycosylase-associated protein family)
MDYAIKLGMGLVIGFLVCFLYPADRQAKPLTSAAFGVIGAVVGSVLSERIAAFGGPQLSPQSLATAGGGAFAFSLAYVGFLSS